MAIGNYFDTDKVDEKIIALLVSDPYITLSQIADKVDRTQPTVGKRIEKLREKGLLHKTFGMSARQSDLLLYKVEVQTSDSEAFAEKMREDRNTLYVFRTTDKYDVSVLIFGSDMEDLERLINENFRKDERVIKVRTVLVTDVAGDIILPINKLLLE